MQTTGIITDINIDYKTRKSKISLLLDTKEIEVVEQLKNENKLNIELKKWYKRRSLDANAYCWVLCDSIAKELSKDGITTKEEIDLLNKLGELDKVPGTIKVDAQKKKILCLLGVQEGYEVSNDKKFYEDYKNFKNYYKNSTFVFLLGML